MKIVYIAGPYSSSSKKGIAANISVAETFARRIASEGIAFICPHLNSRHFEDIKTVDYNFWIKMYTEILKLCDGIFLLPNWDTSEGAKLEKRLAECKFNMPVFFSLNELFKWAKTRRS